MPASLQAFPADGKRSLFSALHMGQDEESVLPVFLLQHPDDDTGQGHRKDGNNGDPAQNIGDRKSVV